MGGAGAGVDSGSTTPGGGGTHQLADLPLPPLGCRTPGPGPSSFQPHQHRPPAPSAGGPLNLGFLSQDELCGPFWRLVLAQRWMGRLKAVAGSQMQSLLEAVNTEIHFVTLCAFQVSPELGRQLGECVKCLPRAYLLEISLD